MIKFRRDCTPEGRENVEIKAKKPARLKINLRGLVEETKWSTFYLFIHKIDQYCLQDNCVVRKAVILPIFLSQDFLIPDLKQQGRGYKRSCFLFDAIIFTYILGLGFTIWPRQKG